MPIATGLALGIAGISAAGAVGSSLIGANAAGDAADQMSAAANNSAALQAQEAQAALDFQKQQYIQQQTNAQPWLQSGTSALANLDNLLGLSVPNTAPGPTGDTRGQTINAAQDANKARYFPDIYTQHGNAFQYSKSQGNLDIYKPYTANQQLMNDPKHWMVAKDGQFVPYSSVPSSILNPPTAGTMPTFSPTGGKSMADLVNPALGAKGSLLQPFGEKFTAPTGATEQNDPGYQFRLQQGMKALQNSAAAKGTLLNGGTAKDIQGFGQDYASNEYGNVYNRAYNEYATRYNQYNQHQSDVFNRLGALSGVGQTTANQLNLLGQNAAGNVTNILGNAGSNIGRDLMAGANARASGSINSANSWMAGLGSLTSLASLLPLLGKGGSSGVPDQSMDFYSGLLG